MKSFRFYVTMVTREIPVALVQVDEYARQTEEARKANGGLERCV